MRTVLSEKGQIIIPKEIRDKFNFKKGDIFEISIKDNAIILKYTGTSKKVNDWKSFRGFLKNKYSIKNFLKERNKDREKENKWK